MKKKLIDTIQAYYLRIYGITLLVLCALNCPNIYTQTCAFQGWIHDIIMGGAHPQNTLDFHNTSSEIFKACRAKTILGAGGSLCPLSPPTRSTPAFNLRECPQVCLTKIKYVAF